MKLKPIHFISGDETLLVQEARDVIIKAARKKGFTGHEYHTADKNFKWETLQSASRSLSLFDDKTIIELRMPTAKPGNAGSTALVDYAKNPAPDKLLLIITSKMEAATKRCKWFKALQEAGDAQLIWPIDLYKLPAWVESRMKMAELSTDRAGIKVIIDATEGNLLATSQEIEKLRLLFGPCRLSADQIASAIADNARFDIFKFVDTIHMGLGAHVLRVLSRLRQEGAEPILINWALARELRTVISVHTAIQQGTHSGMALKQNGVWDKRQPLVKQTLGRVSLSKAQSLLAAAERVDLTIKGLNKGSVWDELERLALKFAGVSLPGMTSR